MSNYDDGNDDDSYEVGYCKPPKEHQFQPGESGNLRGRPPKETTSMISAVESMLMTKERVRVNGKYVYLSRMEMFLMALSEGAIKNPRDRKNLIDLIKALKLQDYFLDLY